MLYQVLVHTIHVLRDKLNGNLTYGAELFVDQWIKRVPCTTYRHTIYFMRFSGVCINLYRKKQVCPANQGLQANLGALHVLRPKQYSFYQWENWHFFSWICWRHLEKWKPSSQHNGLYSGKISRITFNRNRFLNIQGDQFGDRRLAHVWKRSTEAHFASKRPGSETVDLWTVLNRAVFAANNDGFVELLLLNFLNFLNFLLLLLLLLLLV